MDSVSKTELKRRRLQLKRQRRLMVIKSLWRLAGVSSIFGVLFWFGSQSWWTISRPEQIKIAGNRYLSHGAIRSILAIRYPQSLVQLSPAALQQKLMAAGGFEQVSVIRGSLPPRIEIKLVDLQPVAALSQSGSQSVLGLLDRRGMLLPVDRYQTAYQSPKLTVLVAPDRTDCPNWVDLYREIDRSPVEITTLDCTRSNNLFLQTEIGKIRLGSYQYQPYLRRQILQLDRMRNWAGHTNSKQVDYLDLENPDAPKLRVESTSPDVSNK
jgi:cell division protein FtsQ